MALTVAGSSVMGLWQMSISWTRDQRKGGPGNLYHPGSGVPIWLDAWWPLQIKLHVQDVKPNQETPNLFFLLCCCLYRSMHPSIFFCLSTTGSRRSWSPLPAVIERKKRYALEGRQSIAELTQTDIHNHTANLDWPINLTTCMSLDCRDNMQSPHITVPGSLWIPGTSHHETAVLFVCMGNLLIGNCSAFCWIPPNVVVLCLGPCWVVFPLHGVLTLAYCLIAYSFLGFTHLLILRDSRCSRYVTSSFILLIFCLMCLVFTFFLHSCSPSCLHLCFLQLLWPPSCFCQCSR